MHQNEIYLRHEIYVHFVLCEHRVRRHRFSLLRKTKIVVPMNYNFSKSLHLFGLIMIPIKINGNERYFLLDTGSQANGVCDTYQEDMKNFSPSGEKILSRGLNGKTAETDYGELIYEIGKYICKSEFFIIDGNTFNFFKEETGIQISGILGTPFMLQHNCVIDLIKGMLTLNIEDASQKEESQAA